MSLYLFNRVKYSTLKGVRILLLLLLIFLTKENYAQVKKNSVEEINITSSFKPSIVKTGKLEFFPEIPLKDTHSFRFSYPFDAVSFKTPLSSFSLKPLAYQMPQRLNEKNNAFIKVGGGNLSTPFLSAGYQSRSNNNTFSLGVDHISSKGNLQNQQYSNSKVTGQFKRQLADNQSFNVNLGYQGDAYRNYGYDTSKFSFNEDELKQRFNQFSIGAAFDLVAGNNASLFIKPDIQFDYLSTRRGANEMDLQLRVPLTYAVDNNVKLSANLDIDYVRLNSESNIKNSAVLVQLPLKVDYLIDGLYASGGIVPVLKSNKVKLVPDAKLVYTFKEGTSVRLLGGISNIFNVNSLQKLYEINPFLVTPDELTVFQQTNYYAGFDWLNPKGLQLQAKLGFVKFKNLPLFINEGPASADPSGKDFYVLNETSATAFFIESNLGYIFSDKLEFNSTLKAFSFQSQTRYVDPYGILPLELNLGLHWKPIQPLNISMKGQLFGGNMAKEAGKLPFRTKGIFDLGLAVDYNLNKKWTLWIDLNNIANTRYQRWNGYTSFGFNFLLGIKFKFNQLAQ